MPLVRLVAFVLSIGAAASCASTPATPTQPGPLQLSAQIDRPQISVGGTATVTFRLRNTTETALRLDFGTGCQVMPYGVRRPSNDVVFPEGGDWACTLMLTQLVLPPRGERVTGVTIVAGGAPGPASGTRVHLPPGEYAFYARVESLHHTIESPRVTLTVQ